MQKKKLKRIRWMMILTGIPGTALQWFSIIFWIVRGIWWPFVVWALVATVWGTWVSRYYFNHVKYICPECHEVFKPALKEAFWANHTPTARKLTCTACRHKGFCVEVRKNDGVREYRHWQKQRTGPDHYGHSVDRDSCRLLFVLAQEA